MGVRLALIAGIMIAFATLLLFSFVFLLLWTELPRGGVAMDRSHFVRLVFEAQSALGTVGLSLVLLGACSKKGNEAKEEAA